MTQYRCKEAHHEDLTEQVLEAVRGGGLVLYHRKPTFFHFPFFQKKGKRIRVLCSQNHENYFNV